MYTSEKIRNVGKDMKMSVSKAVHRSCNTNQSCVQKSENPCNFEKVYYFVFFVFATQNFDCFMIVILIKTFFVYLMTV